MPNKYIITSNGELIHWGVKGMKWGVRKESTESNKDTHRMLAKLNRANTNMEKHRTVKADMSKQINNGKKSKNLFVKLYGASFILDRKVVSAQYSHAKKKVDGLLDDFERRGVTLKQLREQKTGVSVTGNWYHIPTWSGVRYELE